MLSVLETRHLLTNKQAVKQQTELFLFALTDRLQQFFSICCQKVAWDLMARGSVRWFK